MSSDKRLRKRASNLKQRYGLTISQFDRLKRKTKGVCPICRSRQATHVDHCHKTGLIRGVLCQKCNTGLGMIGDSLPSARRAMQYLSRHASSTNQRQRSRKGSSRSLSQDDPARPIRDVRRNVRLAGTSRGARNRPSRNARKVQRGVDERTIASQQEEDS